MTWQVNGERLVALGWGRAILLQLAHPLVAAGVARHSTVRSSRAAPYVRFRATLAAMRALTFGSDAEAAAAAAQINRIHDTVHGTLGTDLPGLPASTAYSAHDPALLAWVHVTLVDSMLLAFERLVGPLTAAERDRYCAEARLAGDWLGVPIDRLPATAAGVHDALEDARRKGDLQVTAAARSIARQVVRPPFGWMGGPASAFIRRLSIGLLPDDIRAQYGFDWSDADERKLARGMRLVRRLRTRAPAWLARWPEARRRDGR